MSDSKLPRSVLEDSNLGPRPSTNGKGRTPKNTDAGNALRLKARHGGDLRYVHEWRKWLVWDGRRWIVDRTGEVVRRAKETARAMFHEADPGDGLPVDQELAKHAIRSEAGPRIREMIALAESELPATPSQLDADPYLLNALNGTVDLRTGHLRPHDHADLITKLAPVRYDPDAEAPIFEEFLARILPSAPLRGFVQRALGYAASGAVSEEVLVILHGAGANGKSTLVNAVMDALGEYAIQAAPDLLLAKSGAHPTELADLFGARFVAAVETDEGRRLAEGLVKQLTGRDPIKARRMREDFWQFAPTHTAFLSTNHRPEVRGTDHAIWRRIKLVPFEVTIPQDEQDKGLAGKLRAELPGVLSWIVRGHQDYGRRGLGEPDEVTAATSSYRVEMDVLAAFLEDRCVTTPDAWARFSDLYESYQEWCEGSGEKAETKRRFGNQLKERGFEPDRGAGNAPIRRGLGLRDDRRPDPDGGSRVTPSPESYPTAAEGNPDSYAESGEESYRSYRRFGMNSEEPPCRDIYENQGNYGNLGNSLGCPRSTAA